MSRCTALYAKPSTGRVPRTRAELSGDELHLLFPDGRLHSLRLCGCHFEIRDATREQRFVRHLVVQRDATERVDLITPPDRGTIAPRAARLPGAPPSAAVLETQVWEAIVDWLSRGGRLSGRTVSELARLACVATPQFAVTVGEVAARVALELSWENCGPMRGRGSTWNPLHPLEAAARHNQRAGEALVAALSAHSVLMERRG